MEEDFCRICLSKTQPSERQDLFSEKYNNLTIGQLYEEVLNIPIDDEKITLRYICNSCGLQLKLFKQLQNKALETYLFLTDLVHTIPFKNDDRIDDEITKSIETANLLETATLNSTQSKDEYFIENEEKTLTVNQYFDYEDNEQEENEINQNEITDTENTENYRNANDITENIIGDSDIFDNDINGNDIDENYINENEIDGNDTTENYVAENEITESGIIERSLDENIVLRNEHEIEDEEKFIKVEELVKNQEITCLDASEEGYEICYLDEEIIQEKRRNEIDQMEYYNEGCQFNEENANEIKYTSKTIEDKKVFSCPHCDDTFQFTSQLKIHKRKMHLATSKILCPFCNKGFYSQDTYQAHVNIHNGLPPYQCNICQKAFNQKVHYNYHMLNHNNERNIICEVCNKGFITTGDLKTHMRCHTDERPYKCDICEKRFRAHTHMVNHRYSHFEKQFECPMCFQKYMSPNTLRTHLKDVHSTEVPFECKFCEKRFKRKHHLQAHYKTHAKLIDSMVISEEEE